MELMYYFVQQLITSYRNTSRCRIPNVDFVIYKVWFDLWFRILNFIETEKSLIDHHSSYKESKNNNKPINQ